MDEEVLEITDVPMEEERIESDDLLRQILILLPPKSIFRFMSVSKRWLSIIRDPLFIQAYTARRRAAAGDAPLLAFFRSKNTFAELHFACYDECPMDILPIKNHRNTINYAPNLSFERIINTSNGLILCRSSALGFRIRSMYLVVNPVTGKRVTLPPPPKEYNFTSSGIMCEESTPQLAADYIVVRAIIPYDLNERNILAIETYSSRTDEWTESLLVGAGNFTLTLRSPVVVNGVFHWHLIHSDRGIVVYDPNDDQRHLQLIRVPTSGLLFDAKSDTVTISADNQLWFGTTRNGIIEVFKLPKGEDGSYRRKTTISHHEWVLMYSFDGDWDMRLEAFIPWKLLVAVVRKGEKLFIWNLERNRIEKIEYQGKYGDDNYDDRIWPYLESPFLSSYTL